MDLEDKQNRSKTQKNVFLGFLFCAFVAFLLLGSWQLFRLHWKNALIEQVDQRVHAAPSPVPSSDAWPNIKAGTDEYRHVTVQGNLLYQYSVAVQASTALGPGFWLLTPLRESDGSIVYINRGFIKGIHPYLDSSSDKFANQGPVLVTGLLRMSEPKGGFLRSNDPTLNRWYSRDTQMLATSQGMEKAAPFFVDAQEIAPVAPVALSQQAHLNPEGGEAPVMGLTVIQFPNSHLVYAFTWFALALMVAIAFVKSKF